ncbi:MAG: aminomethyl-transferring glycine dehydrogenase subunit GcvPA [Gammaproteobacteria bacterium]|nr:aminomethyl-transferring glycine dehydrogenase subunit GcvPA [Gammaproteobacteria bacterium]
MPFIPHTKADVASMLAVVGAADIDELFDEIPANLLARDSGDGDAAGLTEMETLRRMVERARADETGPCFLGAGAYDHHIPSAVWDIASRGEFMTAYTPYQAEASQGTLQLVYEFQTMMSELTGMDVCNASVYDGGSGLAEAILMAVRAGERRAPGGRAGGRRRASRSRRVFLAGAVNPLYVAAARNIVGQQGIEISQLPHGDNGLADPGLLKDLAEPPAAVVVQQPNFFGLLEDVDPVTDQAHECGALTIACVNPLTLGLLKAPADWGDDGADIACGDGQPLGIPMASGGPSFGFICTRQSLVRQLPGRIVGRTRDLDGKPGFTLTLQAREQHIRRAKATSNICTNQGLLVTGATIYLSLLGPEGLRNVASACHARTRDLVAALGLPRRFDTPYFHECVLRLGQPAQPVVEALAARGILGGLALGPYFSDLADCLLVCATEKRTAREIRQFADTLRDAARKAA